MQKIFSVNPQQNQLGVNEARENLQIEPKEFNLEPLGRLPMWASAGLNIREVKQMNRYLKFMNRRLVSLWKSGKIDQLIWTWCFMLKNSETYQLCLFNRVKRDWYWSMDKHKALTTFLSLVNQMRRWRLNIFLTRFYILKKSGKWRPIGSPTIESRVLTRSFADLIYLLYQDERAKYQHGFMKGRGIHTAFRDIVTMHASGLTKVFEFDFRSFFNLINWKELLQKLSDKSKLLSNLIADLLRNTTYKLKDLRKEAELEHLITFRYGTPKKGKYKHLFHRSGLPQGTNLSPLLSTLTIEGVRAPNGLVMFADDGLCMYHPEDTKYISREVTPWLNGIWFKGAEIAPEKTGIRLDFCKFLGIIIDLERKELRKDEKVFSWNNNLSPAINGEMASEWVKKLNLNYLGNHSKDWEQDPSGLSYLAYQRSELGWVVWIYYLILCWWTGKVHNNQKYYNGIGIRNVTSSSTACLIEIIKDLRSYPRKRKKRLTLKKGNPYVNSMDNLFWVTDEFNKF